MAAAIEIRDLSKGFAATDCPVLRGASQDIAAGEFVALLGRSGSGKSTLLNLISGVDAPDRGSVRIDGTEITALDERARTLFRRRRIGLVFQFFQLIPTLSVTDNVVLPLELDGRGGRPARARAAEILGRVGLSGRDDAFPEELSGGEQQRVALARALVHRPCVLLADEPTGNLDESNAAAVLDLIAGLRGGDGAAATVLMATHSRSAAARADRVLRLHDGLLVPARGRRRAR